jgi:hypothetical protein
MTIASDLMNDFNIMNMETHILKLADIKMKKANKNITHLTELADFNTDKNNATSLINNI